MKTIVTITTHTMQYGTLEWYRTANGTVMIVTADGRRHRACRAVVDALTITEEATTEDSTEEAGIITTPEASTEALTVTEEATPEATGTEASTEEAHAKLTDDEKRAIVDRLAVTAFLRGCLHVGVDGITDEAHVLADGTPVPVMEAGREYSDTSLLLVRGRGRGREVLAEASVPSTRGKVNTVAWYTLLNEGMVPAPADCSPTSPYNPYIPCNDTYPRAIVVRAGGHRWAIKGDRAGRPVPVRLTMKRFAETRLAPIVGAYIRAAREAYRAEAGSDCTEAVAYGVAVKQGDMVYW